MASIRLHSTAVERSTPIPAIRIHFAAVTRTPTVDEPVVRIHAAWLVRGFEPPVVSEGVTRMRYGGAWVEDIVRIRYGGAWI